MKENNTFNTLYFILMKHFNNVVFSIRNIVGNKKIFLTFSSGKDVVTEGLLPLNMGAWYIFHLTCQKAMKIDVKHS